MPMSIVDLFEAIDVEESEHHGLAGTSRGAEVARNLDQARISPVRASEFIDRCVVSVLGSVRAICLSMATHVGCEKSIRSGAEAISQCPIPSVCRHSFNATTVHFASDTDVIARDSSGVAFDSSHVPGGGLRIKLGGRSIAYITRAFARGEAGVVLALPSRLVR
ncbi:hypothetical protein [Antrihabitans spumae]|uniref:Uncharacterized protein n=1 Tax=Antrihabitans spumae TaxID=3373370 RepID=A0ABW7K0H9_9NOCA